MRARKEVLSRGGGGGGGKQRGRGGQEEERRERERGGVKLSGAAGRRRDETEKRGSEGERKSRGQVWQFFQHARLIFLTWTSTL